MERRFDRYSLSLSLLSSREVWSLLRLDRKTREPELATGLPAWLEFIAGREPRQADGASQVSRLFRRRLPKRSWGSSSRHLARQRATSELLPTHNMFRRGSTNARQKIHVRFAAGRLPEAGHRDPKHPRAAMLRFWRLRQAKEGILGSASVLEFLVVTLKR
jgi:hypothetical protein